MTLARERRASDQQQKRPTTSAGPLSPPHASSSPRRSVRIKADTSGPEDASECDSTRASKRHVKAAKKAVAASPQPEAVIDGSRLVTAALRADERQLHAQLLVASEKGSHRAAYLLLHQHLIDKDRCRGMRGYSPLHHAATRGHLEVLRLLLDFGWGVDTRNDALETALHLASYGGHAQIAECLLDRGADVDARTRDLETPLFYATRKSRDRVVRLLVRRECDLSVRNRFGDVAEDEAVDDKTRQELEEAKEDSSRILRGGAQQPTDRPIDERALSQQTRERVLSFLDVRSLCRASRTAFRWHRAADNPALWKKLGVSRWELQLNSSMGLGASALGTLSILTARRSGVKPSAYPAMSVGKPGFDPGRPASCDQAGSRFLMPRIQTKQRLARDDARPQTASIV